MAKLATCPSCTTQLALPEQATLSDRARCPRCQEEFLLMETVQFSIPEAELLPPVEVETETFAPTVEDQYAPTTFARETASDGEESIEGSESETLPVSATPSTQKTLSDWEARLKRAIAADVDDLPQEEETTLPQFEFRNLTTKAPAAKTEPTPEPEDYAVSDDDLFPQTTAKSAPQRDDWSPEDAYAPEEYSADDEPVIDSYTDHDAEEPEPAIAFNVQTDSAPRNKRKRNPLRTLASASLGVVGIPLGLYALLWLRGPSGDVLHLAQYVPSFLLPAAFEKPSFEELAEQPSTTTSREAVTGPLSDDAETEIASAEPLLRDDPAVAPASAEEPVYRGPIFAPVNASEFNELLAVAEPVVTQLGTGDLKSKESVARKGQAYMALARLADRSSYLNWPGHTPEEATKTLLAKQLFDRTLRDEVVQRDLPQIALRWWQYAERPSSGIVLTGRVERLETTAIGTIAFVSLSTEPVAPEIPVLVGNAEHREGERIGIVGSIMTNPQEQMPALEVTAYPLVIAHFSFPLADDNISAETQVSEPTQ
ncbi:MAG: hypothetical protein SH868_04200 [Bythopirellula sp.]|nr:hypothetical protein [Bythopirellula sp.]